MADPPVRAVIRLALRTRYWGIRHIPQSGPALLAANHVSVLDPVVIALAVSALGRTVRFLAGAEFFDRPVLGFALRAVSQIPVRRGGRDWRALEELGGVIRQGTIAGIFPEGRVGSGRTLGRGRQGAARIAMAAGVPIIPIGIWGTQHRWPRPGLRPALPLRPLVATLFGPPISVGGDPRSRSDVAAVTSAIMAGIHGQVEQAKLAARSDS